ncbi:LysR family transcriptional regulator [uncultured Jatrophihabitans sp.]|uniref:LysR family transcriptional regulator n=1 Tax=uncultured Jatrophihabitans sp. TaxID=1610747 RepID=UPI0035CBC910
MPGVLDVVALRSLVAIADTGGFRRAADELNLSQSAVSQHVRRLELVSGRSLVARDGRATRFTRDGERLLADARAILAAHDDALARLLDHPGTQPGFVIGATEHAADLLLPAVTTRLRTQFPDQPVRFRIDRGHRLHEGIDDASIDAALLIGDQRGHRTRAGGALPLTWFTATDAGPLDTAQPVPLVVIDGPCTIRRRAVESLGRHRIPASVVCEAGHLAGVLGAVRAGVGVALVAHSGPPPEGLRLEPGLPAVLPEPMHVRGGDATTPDVLDAVAEAARYALSGT